MRFTQGSVVSRWMLERPWARVCYVGDGAGDICGWCAVRLAVARVSLPRAARTAVGSHAHCSAATGVTTSRNAFIFARENLALHKGMAPLLKGGGSSCGILRTWSGYEQLHALLQEWMA